MKKILVIDDLKGDLLLIKSIIEANFEDTVTLTAKSGRLGLQIAKSQQPDVILLDIVLPDIDGYEVARRLRNNSLTKDIPVIMITGNIKSESVMEKALNAGGDVFLYKPVNQVELTAQVNAVLRIKKTEDKLFADNKKLQQKSIELEASKLAYKKLLNELPLALVIHNEGVIKYVNPKGVQLLGAESYKDLINVPITRFIHPNHLDEEMNKLINLIESDESHYESETVLLKTDGTSVPVSVTSKKTHFNNTLSVQLVIQDISERKKNETEREQLLNQMQIGEKISKSGSWRYNVLSDKLVFSENLLRIFEFDTNTDDNINTDIIFSYIHPDDRKKILKIIKDVFFNAKTEINPVEHKIITKKGNVKYILGTASPIFNSNNQLIEIIGSARDITEEKETHLKLKESEERFGITFDLNPDPISINEIETGKYIAVNKAFVKETGYTRKEVIGKTVLDLNIWFDNNDRKKFYNKILENPDKEVHGFETKFRNKKGEIVASLLSAKIIKINNKDYFFNIVKNIQSLKDKESIIETERKKLHTYFDIAQVILLVLDVDGNVAMINKKGCEILGRDDKEIIGKNWYDNFLPAEKKETTKKLLNRLIKTNTNSPEFYDNVIINAKGEKLIIAWHNAVITDENGKVTGILASGEDVTLKRKQERELVKAKEQAMESDRLKSAFLANMSHEIRTPMNAILGFTQLLKEPDFPEEERQEFINIIYESGKSLLELINDIIDISTIEAGQIKIKLHRVSLNNLNKEVYNLFKLQASEKGIKLILENHLPDGKDVITTDELKIKQVLINLVGNAMKFTSKGHIRFGYKQISDKIEYFVEDTGLGIPEKYQPYVFDRFRKFEMYDKNKMPYKGTGLGLSISKGFIEHLGGEIYFTSEENKGTTFFFYLPYNTTLSNKNNKSKIDMNKQEISKSLEGKKILIAEDDAYVVKYLEMALKPLKLKIIVANNGEEAINYVKNDPEIALVLMDIRMPVMGGHEATQLIKKERPDLPIIAQTAFALAGDKEKALEAGCDDYISKPINRTQLISLIEKYIL